MRITFNTDYMNLNYVEFKMSTETDNTRLADRKLLKTLCRMDYRLARGQFSYQLTDIRICNKSWEGKDFLDIGEGLVPGVFNFSQERYRKILGKALKKPAAMVIKQEL